MKGYRFWGQPYIHREEFVQSRLRKPPHEPDPRQPEYRGLARLGRRVATDSLVLLAAADWDFRRIVRNWLSHARALSYTNTLVLSMDTELHSDLTARGVASFDSSMNVAAWNRTCLQRHVQRVRTERLLALAALVRARLDVLLCDATVVFVRDVLPTLRAAAAAGADLIGQRHECPPNVGRHTGSGINPGFLYARAAKADALVDLIKAAVARGLVEFYHRWDNVPDHFGLTYVLDQNDLRTPTSKIANETTIFTLRHPRSCEHPACLRAGFLPHDLFPRFGSWPLLRNRAIIHHIVGGDAALGPQHAAPPGIKPARAPRQRLDRYDEIDFDTYEAAMREMGLWDIANVGHA